MPDLASTASTCSVLQEGRYCCRVDNPPRSRRRWRLCWWCECLHAQRESQCRLRDRHCRCSRRSKPGLWARCRGSIFPERSRGTAFAAPAHTVGIESRTSEEGRARRIVWSNNRQRTESGENLGLIRIDVVHQGAGDGAGRHPGCITLWLAEVKASIRSHGDG